MKKLLAVMAVVAMLTTAGGCSTWNNMFRRGEPCNTCGPQMGQAAMPVDGSAGYLPPPGAQ